MRDITRYGNLVGFDPPWKVSGVDVYLAGKEVVVRVAVEEGVLWGCPVCTRRMHVHDWHERAWRHVDTCQFRTIIKARVPRVKCSEHVTMRVRVSWGGATTLSRW